MFNCTCTQPAVAWPLCDFSCRVLTPLLLLSLLTIAAVVYHVDHATSSIYMERVEGHSLKTLLHGGDLGGTGERQQQGQWVNLSRLAGADGITVHVATIMSFRATDLLACRLHTACASLRHLCCIQAHLYAALEHAGCRAGGAAGVRGAHHCQAARRRAGARRPDHLQHDAAHRGPPTGGCWGRRGRVGAGQRGNRAWPAK